MSMHKCGKCDTIKQKSEFARNAARTSGVDSYCKTCRSEYIKQYRIDNLDRVRANAKKNRLRNKDARREYDRTWRARNPEKCRAAKYRTRYGIDLADYESMLLKQGGKCKLCESESPGGYGAYFHVDHCHDSKNVRGLLCGSCNKGLGCFKDSIDLLERAKSYLTRS